MESKSKERYWTFILYPESAPENWKEILRETGLHIAISPLHNKDINITGEKKKEHYHIVLFFDGPTTYKRVASITEELKATIPQRVMSPIGAIRYLTHKDNPEKAQYDERDIITLNGLDLKDINGLTTSMVLQIKRAIIRLSKEQKIYEYSEMYDYLDSIDMVDMIDVLTNHTIFFNAYFKSKHFTIREKLLDSINRH